jgi:hypothetical protein
MKKALKMLSGGVFYFVDGKKIQGLPTGLSGNVTGLRGDVTGLRGDVTGLSGDVDKCEITEEERLNGINIRDLVGGE